MKKTKNQPIKIEPPIWEGKTCDECCIGHYSTKFDNLALDGSPTLIECMHNEWRVLLTNKACEQFKPKSVCIIK